MCRNMWTQTRKGDMQETVHQRPSREVQLCIALWPKTRRCKKWHGNKMQQDFRVQPLPAVSLHQSPSVTSKKLTVSKAFNVEMME